MIEATSGGSAIVAEDDNAKQGERVMYLVAMQQVVWQQLPLEEVRREDKSQVEKMKLQLTH